MLMAAHHYDLAPDVVLQQAEGEALLVKLHDEDMFGLNETGAAVVERLSAGLDVETTIEELAMAYGAPLSEIRRDVHALVAELTARGLLLERRG